MLPVRAVLRAVPTSRHHETDLEALPAPYIIIVIIITAINASVAPFTTMQSEKVNVRPLL